MTTYSKKYFGYFGDMNNVQHTVELWVKDETVAEPTEMLLHANPFSVSMPEIDSKFQAVRGTGCNLNILSETDMQYFGDFVFSDAKKWMVKHYIGSSLNWVGWLNSELYREPYDVDFNYQINMTGNDGFALTERFTYVKANGDHFTGISSLWDILSYIVGCTELPFTEIRVALSTSFTGYSSAVDSTILHEQYVDNANFYDEDDYPLTQRRTLEGILLPFGAFITQAGAVLYVTDIHTLATGGAIDFQCFVPDGTLGTYKWNYSETIAISPTKSVVDIGYMGMGQELEIGGGVNKQVVVYSPYPTKAITEASRANVTMIAGYDEFTGVPANWSDKDGYHYKTLTGNKYWNTYSPATTEVAMMQFEPTYTYATVAAMNADTGPNAMKENITYICSDDTINHYHWSTELGRYVTFPADQIYGTPEMFHIRVPYCVTNQKVAAMIEKPYVVMTASKTIGTGTNTTGINGTGLFIKGKFGGIAYQNKNNAIEYPENIIIKMKIRVGSYYYIGRGINGTWETTEGFCEFNIQEGLEVDFLTLERTYSPGTIRLNDPFNEPRMITLGDRGAAGIWVPVNRDLSGELEIELWSDMRAGIWPDPGNSIYSDNSKMSWMKEYWISNITVDLQNVDGSSTSEIDDSDVEYIGILDKTYKEEGKKCELICGTEKKTTDRAKLMSFADTVYSNIYDYIRQGQTFRAEYLLLNSYCSNYKKGYAKLNSMKLNNTINQINVLTDSFLTDKKMMVKGFDTDYWNSVTTVTLEEIFPDQLEIVPLTTA